MQQRLKERLVGAAVLVVLAVIFIPMILTGPVDTGKIESSNIPSQPAEPFKPTLVPISSNTETVTRDKVPITDTTIDIPSAEPDKSTVETATIAAESEASEVLISQPVTAVTEPQSKVNITPKVEKSGNDEPVGLSAWVVQLGSFGSKVNADKLNLSLRKEGFPAFVEPIEQDNKTVYRVRVGPELLRSDAEKLLASINKKLKLNGIVLRYP